MIFVCFEDQLLYPHTHLTINNNISIPLLNERHMYKLVSLTYYNGIHFIQKVRLNNDDILRYDGMGLTQGRAQLEMNTMNDFPSKFLINNTTWYAHTAWYQKVQTVINANIMDNNNSLYQASPLSDPKEKNSELIIDLADESSQESAPQDRNTYNNSKKRSNHGCSNINSCQTEFNPNKRKSRSSSSCSSSSSSNSSRNKRTIHNINTIYNEPNPNNCQIYPIISPPPIVIAEDSEQQDRKRFRNQDSVRNLTRKRTISEVAPQSPLRSNSRRPKGLCSPGTAEGPTGQG